MSLFDQLLVLAFLALTAWLGIRRPAREGQTPAGYLLDGRRLTLPAFVATTVSTWYGGILGVSEYSFRYGLSNWLVFGVPYYLGALIFALLLAERARRSEALTLPEQMSAAYGRGPAAITAGIVAMTTLPAAYVLILGVLAQNIFGIARWLGIAVAAAFSVAYVWRGGFRSVVRTDVLQFALMFGGFALMLGLLVAQHGFEPLQTRVPASHWSWNGGRSPQAILVWYFIALSTLVEPTFYQRCFAAASPQVARRGLLISIACWMCFDALTTFTGLYARALLTELPASRATEAFPLLALKVLPAGLCGLFFVSMLATVMSTVDSYLFVAASTFGRDLLGRTERFGGRIAQTTRWGLLVCGALTLLVAWLSESVVSIWHGFGSVTTAALLIPVTGAFVPRLKLSRAGALVHMVAVFLFTAFWLSSREWIAGGGYLLGVEPIYAGLALGVAVWGGDRLIARRRAAEIVPMPVRAREPAPANAQEIRKTGS
ncbi:MAG: sodium:solute symporter family protein [Myxococcales bacterium]